MKSLRKSLNGSAKDSNRSNVSSPFPSISKPLSSVLPPQKVIRALSHYQSHAPQQLSFQKGDFFHVLRDVDDHGEWFEAHNPASGARGLVPRSEFEELGRNAISPRISSAGPSASPSPSAKFLSVPKPPVFYAVVLHDFVAERADELDAKAGDSITVVAQSNREWFVAKPIGRIGRPGLIPVSFVQIQDPTTGRSIEDVDGLIDRAEIPKVEDWKRAMLSYKQNSIALGVIDTPNRDSSSFNLKSTSPVLSTSSRDNQSTSTQEINVSDEFATSSESGEPLAEGLLLTASVVSFHYEMEEYWFRIDGVFQPYPKPGGNQLPPAKQLILFRIYNDFYDFQVSLLDTFPREAGRWPSHERILPFMPGPADEVDDQLTATRRTELDQYVQTLCALSNSGYRYILESRIVRSFLALKPGDVENEIETRVHELEALPDSQHGFRYSDDHSSSSQSRSASFSTQTQSTPATNFVNTPPISANNPQPAFVKIKVFDKEKENLFAIRVHPRVTHSELFDKVQEKLQRNVAILTYQDGSTNFFEQFHSENELRLWLENTDRHVLFAD